LSPECGTAPAVSLLSQRRKSRGRISGDAGD